MDHVLVLTLAGAVVAGFVQGTSGFAFGLVAMAFWAWVLPPQTSAFLVVAGGLLGQLLLIRTMLQGFAWRNALPLIVGGYIGVPLGVMALPLIDQTVFRVVVGTILVVWCPLMLLIERLPAITTTNRLADATAGVLGGLMGGVGGLPGPAVTLWSALRAWDKAAQRAVIQSFNLAMQLATLILYAASARIDAEALRLFAIVAPAMIVPGIAGAWLFTKLNAGSYRQLLLWLLLLSGLGLLGASLPKLVSSTI